ncbi:glycine zipper 2TM domain-containing protein [Arenimonas composti]|uniref:Glycine zipper 2TM domain-containing protein n=1 Tax=Arenimonas composti TR7-09 = DSM 18010 TaxID=1121013 RepID=A0A091BEZ5_9GAMM|nr:glycine zipper 2TM domain-containing protein [Arenimonas composti]KFN49379.1 hypothetical protein P873_01020 [Arenimonas composti TR7-09 = DSM 18010]
MRASPGLFLPLLLVMTGSVAAQYPDPRDEGASAYAAVEENVSYGYAQVLRADEVVETVRTRTPEERCDGDRRDDAAAARGTVIGAIVGAAVGNQIGDGDGRRAATVAGAVVGGAVGRRVAEENAEPRPGCYIVEVEREERQVVGYDVEYMYKGEKYMSRLPWDPGNRLRIRVSVTPDIDHASWR